MVEIAEIDAVGMACPRPVIELANAIEGLQVGDRVRLRADDVAAKVDIPVWCRMKRHRLESSVEHDGVWTFVVRKAAS
jgi:TusA-related sulfurtransferase